MTSSESPSDPRLGTVVADKYRVEAVIGRGGMGVVYRATHQAIGKRVALKFLELGTRSDAESVSRFQREAEAASAVESPHVAHIFDAGWHEGAPFLVLELLTGETLGDCLLREGRLEPEVAVRLVRQILRALVRTHEAGIVHRDLKPDNVFLCHDDGAEPHVKLLDFGISKIVAGTNDVETLTRRGVVMGTAFYMSPEQARGAEDIDGRTDLYAVGALLFECLAGRPPHTGRVYEAVLVDICMRDAEDIRVHAPMVPEALALTLARALKRERGERFSSAREFLESLEQGQGDSALVSSNRALGQPIDTVHRGNTALSFAPTESVGAIALPPRSEPDDTVLEANPASESPRRGYALFVSLLVAVLATFVVTAVAMSRRSSADNLASTSATVASSASALPAARASAAASAGEPEAALRAPPAASTGHRTKAIPSSSKPPARPLTAASAAAPRQPATGVAGGLKLKTTLP